MSTTFTVHQVEEVLEDYKIHLTGSDDNNIASPSTRELPRVDNPSNWPTDRRRIPDYRPVDRTLYNEDRPNGSSVPEIIFIGIMFTGVFLNASTAKLWGATGGPYFPRLFRYAIGGEW